MLRCYVRDHPRYWYECVQAVTNAYNTSKQSATDCPLLERELSRHPANHTLSGDIEESRKRSWVTKEDWVLKMVEKISKAWGRMSQSQLH